MRNSIGLPCNKFQLTSLPSPSRHLMNNNSNNTHNTTSTSTDIIQSSPILFEQPTHLNSKLYPLANLETPKQLKRFNFHLNGKLGLFEELESITPRKRSASSWEDDRDCKRLELEQDSQNATTNTTYSPYPTSSDSIIMDSPNSALPSPVSDLEEYNSSIKEEEEMDNVKMEDIVQVKLEDVVEVKMEDIVEQDLVHVEPTTDLSPNSDLIHKFDTLPDNIQSYLMLQLLKRSPLPLLRMANDSILEALKVDFLDRLPTRLAWQVLSYLDVPSLCRASCVSKRWNRIINNADDVWKLKITEANFILTIADQNQDNKQIIKRHTIMRKNWRLNRHRKMHLDGHEEDLVTCLQFDDEKIITGSDDHSINVYDIQTGELKQVLKGHDGGVWALQYVGDTLVTGSIDRTVRVWDIRTGKCRYILRGHSSTVRCLKIVMPAKIVKPDGSVVIEPSEPIIVSGSRDMTIRVWRLPDINQDEELPLSTGPEDDIVSNRYLKFKLAEHEHSVRDLAVHGNTLVSGSYDNNVIVWDLETGNKVHTLKGHTMKVYCVAIDPKRRHCISGSLDASVRIWGLDDGECKYVLQGHSILVGLLGLVDDCLVSAAADATLRIWDPSNGERLRILAGTLGHQGPITSFQHDQYKIISGSEGGVKMWDTQTGKLLYDLIEDVAGVWRVCFDERRCIAAVKNEHKTQLIVLDFGIHGIESNE